MSVWSGSLVLLRTRERVGRLLGSEAIDEEDLRFRRGILKIKKKSSQQFFVLWIIALKYNQVLT